MHNHELICKDLGNQPHYLKEKVPFVEDNRNLDYRWEGSAWQPHRGGGSWSCVTALVKNSALLSDCKERRPGTAHCKSASFQHRFIIPGPGSLRQEASTFESSLCYPVRYISNNALPKVLTSPNGIFCIFKNGT